MLKKQHKGKCRYGATDSNSALLGGQRSASCSSRFALSSRTPLPNKCGAE